MANADSLRGKEFIDFLLNYLRGRDHQPEGGAAPAENSEAGKVGSGLAAKKQLFCFHELKADEAKKLLDVLKKEGEDVVLYFNVKDGFKVLIDSLNFGLEALPILSAVLTDDDKLRDEF